jgi:hypothetical protein
MRPLPTISDHSRYSRAFLGQGIYGKEYDERCADLEHGSKALLSALWQRHQRVMLVAEANGRQVVRP